MVALCVDAGTTVIKAVAYDDDGAVISTARQPTSIETPRPGHAEQDMSAVWAAVADTIRTASARSAQPIDLIAFTAQGDGAWLVDRDGRPTGKAVLWNDARAADIVTQWHDEGRSERAFQINGAVGFAGLPHAILAWFHAHHPDQLGRSHACLTCGGWLFQFLTGETAMDESDAAAPWLEVRQRHYSPDILELYDMSWAERLLPPLRADDSRVAPLEASVAESLGLTSGIPVVMAPYDIASTAIGAGAVEERQACTILGTTLCTEIVTETVDTSGRPTGLTIPLGTGDRYLRSLPTLAGTQVLTWAAAVLGLADEAEVCRVAATADAGAGGLMFLPYLSPAGERVPFVDPAARGAFAGLSFDHDRPAMARAVLEGLTYVIRECLEVSKTTPSELRVCGGGAQSPEWCQVIADVLGVPVLRLADTEVGARGAFISGMVATGRARDHAAAVRSHVTQRDRFAPDSSRHRLYNQLYREFLAVREDSARSWKRLTRIRGVA